MKRLTLLLNVVLFLSLSMPGYEPKQIPRFEDPKGPLSEFIECAKSKGLPTAYLERVNSAGIELKFGSGPEYENRKIYLPKNYEHTWLEKRTRSEGGYLTYRRVTYWEVIHTGNLLPCSRLSRSQINSIYHETFHAYCDLFLKGMKTKGVDEIDDWDKIEASAEARDVENILGEKVTSSGYKLEASEEAMAVYLGELVDTWLYWKEYLDKSVKDYRHGKLTVETLDTDFRLANKEWQKLLQGSHTTGYYYPYSQKFKYYFGLAKTPSVSVKQVISTEEKKFVLKHLLPGFEDSFKKPPLDEFIRDAKLSGLPTEFLNEVNYGDLWKYTSTKSYWADFSIGKLKPFSQMSADEVAQVFRDAFLIYWDELLINGKGRSPKERKDFETLKERVKSYYHKGSDQQKIEIAKEALAKYQYNLIVERQSLRLLLLKELLTGSAGSLEFYTELFRHIVAGKEIRGYYYDWEASDNGYGKVFAERPPSNVEKEFLLKHILPGIEKSFGKPPSEKVVSPAPQPPAEPPPPTPTPEEEGAIQTITDQVFTPTPTLAPTFTPTPTAGEYVAEGYRHIELVIEHYEDHDCEHWIPEAREAIRQCTMALEQNLDYDEAHFCRALGYIYIEEPIEAINDLKRALELGLTGEKKAKAEEMLIELEERLAAPACSIGPILFPEGRSESGEPINPSEICAPKEELATEINVSWELYGSCDQPMVVKWRRNTELVCYHYYREDEHERWEGSTYYVEEGTLPGGLWTVSVYVGATEIGSASCNISSPE